MANPCITAHFKELSERYDELRKTGLSDRDAAMKAAIEKHQSIFNDLNKFKESIGIKLTKEQKVYTVPDNSSKVKEITDSYNKKIEALSKVGSGVGGDTKATDDILNENDVTSQNKTKNNGILDGLSHEEKQGNSLAGKFAEKNSNVTGGVHDTIGKSKGSSKDIRQAEEQQLKNKTENNAELTKLLPDTLSPTEKQGSIAGGEENAAATVITGTIHAANESAKERGKGLSSEIKNNEQNKLSDTKEETGSTNKEADSNIGEATQDSGEGGGGKKPPVDNTKIFGEGEDANQNKKDFDNLTANIPGSGEVKNYLSGDTILKYESDTELRNSQKYISLKLDEALKHGVDTIEKAKEIFGDDFAVKTLDYIEQNNIPIENKALLYVSLENEIAKQILADPTNLGLKKIQDLVRQKSQAFLSSNAKAINMGRLRAFAKTGYDITQSIDKLFTSTERENKRAVENLLQADAETIQKQYEEKFNEKVEEAAEKLRATERAKERTSRKERVHKAIDATMEKWAKKLSADLPEGTQKQGFGDIHKILKSVGETMKAAYDTGVAVERAVQDAIDYITDKLGKDVWDKIDVEEFRKDNEAQLRNGKKVDIEAQQKRQSAKEYQMLETERNRQLKRVGDLTERLKSLEAGIHPETGAKTAKLDVPEIEALKAKVKDEAKKLNAIEAQQKKIDDLEAELERLQKRLPKEKSNSVKRQISEREQEIKTKIEAEKETINKENKANNGLRLSDAKEAVRQRIEKIKTEIANKERELVEKNKPLNEDLELARLKEIEKSITELRDKYLPEEKDPYEAEKQREKAKDKLVNDIIDLNEQINARKRTQKPDKADYSKDAEISKLTAIKEAKKAILNEIDPLAVPKEKTTAERTTEAEQRVQERIDAVREEIKNGELALKKSKDKKLQSKKLEQLKEQEQSLIALRDRYLPKDKDTYANEKLAKVIEKKLVQENIELNRQIAKGEKDVAEGKTTIESEKLNKLKAERDARKEILEAIDPTPKLYVENALIGQGFGKTIKVKTKNGTEERQVLDWKKLAGAEGSVTKISEHVAKALEKSGFTPEQLERVQDGFITEYTNVRKDVIEKGLNVIAQRNKTVVTADQKSAAKKLAEMYNYGLFDKDLTAYEIVLAKTIGVDKLSAERLKEVIELGKATAEMLATDFQGKRLTESQVRAGIQRIDELMRYVLNAEANAHGSTALKLADAAQTYMDLTQRMVLNSLKQAAENPISGRMESLFSAMGYAGSIPKVLNADARKMARQIYKEIVFEKGAGYGDVQSAFISKGNLERGIEDMSDSKLIQGIISTVIGKTTLDAVDSMYKSKITQQKFVFNLITVLQKDRLIDGKVQKGMSKLDAQNYVAEKLTGQSFEDAQATAKEIIDKVNKGAGKKIFNDSPLFVDRLAHDIVTAALVNGEKISAEMVDASYNSAYKAAGRGMGHVANNIISSQVGNLTGGIETKYRTAVKEKEYNKAAVLRMTAMLFRNVINPFVGGGSNWVVLKVEKTGLGLLSGAVSMAGRGKKVDLTSESGIKNLENAMYDDLKIKDKFIRGAVGGVTTALSALIVAGITSDDEYKKWRSKNMWAAKYLDIITPEIILASIAQESGKMKKYFENFANKNENTDKGIGAIKMLSSWGGGKKEAPAQTGTLVGSTIGVPIPWRLIRDGHQIWAGLTGGEVYKVNSDKPETFMQGYLKGGMLDYLGVVPHSETTWFTGKENGNIKMLTDKGIELPKKPSKDEYEVDIDGSHPEGLLTEPEYKDLIDTYKEEFEKKLDIVLKSSHIVRKELPNSSVVIQLKSAKGYDLDKTEKEGDIEGDGLGALVEKAASEALEIAKDKVVTPLIKPKSKITVE